MDNQFGNGALPGNSHKAKESQEATLKTEPQKVQRITTSEPVTRKPPLGRRFKQLFLGGESQGVLNWLAMDVLIPGAKDLTYDLVMQGLQRRMFGDNISGRARPGMRSGGHTPYQRYSVQNNQYRPEPREPQARDISRRGRATHDFNEIVLDKRIEAEEVIDTLFSILEKYGSVNVTALYDLVGIPSNFTDNKWGWVDLRGAKVIPISNGYLLDLPRPSPLD